MQIFKKMRYKIQKSSNNNKRTFSGGDTTVYLRKKTVKDFPLRQEERNLQKQELDIVKSKEEASQN